MTSIRSIAGARGILLDIEGTTTPIAFVHDVLFSYARSRVKGYLTEHFGSAELVSDLARLREDYAADVERNLQPPTLIDGARRAEIDSMADYIHWLIDRDRKSTGLKLLQGKIWREGYLDGSLKAELFIDVAPALHRWRRVGLKISIFSSGSILAQQLLFAHTDAGDLTPFIDNYFDTTSGSKTARESYQNIALALNLSPREILFVSDSLSELDAAGAASMQTLLCIRPGNQPQSPAGRHQVVTSLEEIPEGAFLTSDPLAATMD
jgi:enolase-phosphatase E1